MSALNSFLQALIFARDVYYIVYIVDASSCFLRLVFHAYLFWVQVEALKLYMDSTQDFLPMGGLQISRVGDS